MARPTPTDDFNCNSVLNDARKRFEMDLMRNRQREVEDERELQELEDENKRFEMATQIRK